MAVKCILKRFTEHLNDTHWPSASSNIGKSYARGYDTAVLGANT